MLRSRNDRRGFCPINHVQRCTIVYIYTYNLYYIYNIIYVLYIAIIILYPSIQGDDEATMMYVPLAIKHGWLENP